MLSPSLCTIHQSYSLVAAGRCFLSLSSCYCSRRTAPPPHCMLFFPFRKDCMHCNYKHVTSTAHYSTAGARSTIQYTALCTAVVVPVGASQNTTRSDNSSKQPARYFTRIHKHHSTVRISEAPQTGHSIIVAAHPRHAAVCRCVA